jgi:hypothetical protein
MLTRALIVSVLLLATALAAFPSGTPDFSGMWLLSEPALPDDKKIEWTIEQEGDKIRLVQSRPVADGKTEVTCGTRGKDCEATIDSRKAKVAFWYNGQMLVEMRYEDKGERVTKTRRKLSADGKTMTVEVIQILPTKDSQRLVFVRSEQQQAAR